MKLSKSVHKTASAILILLLVFIMSAMAVLASENEDPDIEYIYIESPVLPAGENQHMIANLTGLDESITNIELVLTDEAGQEIYITEDARYDNDILFILPDTSAMSGIYKAAYISYEKNGQHIVLDVIEEIQFSVVSSEIITDNNVASLENNDLDIEAQLQSVLGSVSDSLAASDNLYEASADGSLVIVLDPGHGGDESGAAYNGYLEKDLNLQIALSAAAQLRKYENVEVYLTREDDLQDKEGHHLFLKERVDFAQSVGADIIISIHNNASEAHTSQGSELYVTLHSSYREEQTVLGNRILEALTAFGLENRGVMTRVCTDGEKYDNGEDADYYSIINYAVKAHFPGMIIEHGFMDNSSDQTILVNHLTELGVSDANAIANYYHLSLIEQNPVNILVNGWYDIFLGREPDPNGKSQWVNALKDHSVTASAAMYGFVFSQEYLEHNNSDSQFIDDIYAAAFNRTPDDGKKQWEKLLDSGMSRQYVLKGILASDEFTKLCLNTSIERGELALEDPKDQNEGITGFVHRLYATTLNRLPENDGLNNWCAILLNKEWTPKKVAFGFVFSNEAISQNLSNEAYVKMLYQTFMDRDSDSEGLDNWVNQLEEGKSREDIFNGFADSTEFTEIIQRFGL